MSDFNSAISNQIEVLSKSIVSSISSLTFPHDSKFHGKDKKSTGKPALLVDSIDISILLLMHIVSSTKLLKEIMIKKHHKQESTINHSLYSTLLMPCLNSFISSYGKVVMDSFSNTEHPINSTVESGEISLIGRHILSQFPDMASKKHKSTGKLLLHHAVYKYKHSVTNSAALDTVKLILKIAPESAKCVDTNGALPFHWAMRNTDASQELIEILLSANPESLQTADNGGYLPLHLAVSMEQPNLETVRKLLALYPAAAAMHTLPKGASTSGESSTGGGCLPLHLCVNRETPSLPVIRALVDIYANAVKTPTSDMQGSLPLHLCVNRDRPHFEAVALLVALHPDGIRSVNSSNQTALHRLLENIQPSSDNFGGDEVLRFLLDRDSSVLKVRAEVDGCLPLHLLLDCAHPNYALAEHMLALYPEAAEVSNNDGLLPMHVLLSAAENPPLSFVRSLLESNRECLGSWVTDIVPASTGKGNKHGNTSGWEVNTSSGASSSGKSTIDLELWSGEWYERRWSPLIRAKERELHDIVKLFTTTLTEQFGVSAEEANAFVADPLAVVDIENERKQQQKQQPEDRRSSSVHSSSSKSDAKRFVPGSSSSMSVRKPSQFQSRNNRDDDSVDSDLDGNRLQQDSLSLSADSALSGGSYSDRDRRIFKQPNLMATYPPPDGKYMPPHLISAKKRATPMMDNLFSSTTPNTATGLESVKERDTGAGSVPRPQFQPPSGAPPSVKMMQGGTFRPGGPGSGMAPRAPLPSGPIPATLLQVAESSALRFIKESNRDEIMRVPSASSSKNVSPVRSVQAPSGVAPPGALPAPTSPAPTMSISAVLSLSRPISRPTSRPGSGGGYRSNAKDEGLPSSGNKSALTAAASLLMGDGATNSARRNEEDDGKVVDGNANVKSKVKPPSSTNATSLSMLKNHAGGKKVYPAVVASVDNVV